LKGASLKIKGDGKEIRGSAGKIMGQDLNSLAHHGGHVGRRQIQVEQGPGAGNRREMGATVAKLQAGQALGGKGKEKRA
jgi:hypothetical protein